MSLLRPAAQLSQAIARQQKPSSVPLRIFATCLTGTLVAVHYTNYSPLIATLRIVLQANSAQVGLLSTLLFLGLAIAYIPAGMLADRFGGRPVLISSTILLTGGGVLLPLFPNLLWISYAVFCLKK